MKAPRERHALRQASVAACEHFHFKPRAIGAEFGALSRCFSFVDRGAKRSKRPRRLSFSPRASEEKKPRDRRLCRAIGISAKSRTDRPERIEVKREQQGRVRSLERRITLAKCRAGGVRYTGSPWDRLLVARTSSIEAIGDVLVPQPVTPKGRSL